MDLYGRDFLRILDFGEDELRYMLAMAKQFKKMKQNRQTISILQIKTLLYYLKKLQQERDARLRLQDMISEWVLHFLILPVLRWDIRSL